MITDEQLEQKIEKAVGGHNKILEKDSIQFNCQDLDQEQKVDVNPKQLNSQNIHIYVSNSSNNYSAKITGTAYIDKSKKTIKDTKIYLYFGTDLSFPVHQVNSDSNGNFVIDDLPPGYYTLCAKSGSMEYKSHYIKLLPCQSTHESLLLKRIVANSG